MTTSNSVLTVKLGGKDYSVLPLKLGQVERLAEVQDAVVGSFKMENGKFIAPPTAKGTVNSARRVVAIGLEARYPDDAKDDCANIEATATEVFAASQAIMIHSGLRMEEPKAGEREAGAAPAPASA